MRILYYTWFENSQEDMEETLVLLGYEVVKCNIPFQNYDRDEIFFGHFSEVVEKYECDCIFSFNFFPIIAQIAEKFQIKYISWVYDCPHWTLYSPEVKNAYNYIFVFDQSQFIRLHGFGIAHLYHLPLAVNTRRLCKLLGTPKYDDPAARELDREVSFVGSLYENNLYDQIRYLPEYLKGYLEGLMRAQQKIYGYNFVEELLNVDIMQQINSYVSMELPEGYLASKRELYTAMLNSKITFEERILLLDCLSQKHSLTLYTASDMTRVPGASAGGTVDYMQEMPRIFRESKINLNITLRSIQSGIPLRALDIMGAGGFLISNYQPELAEQFEDGKELVLYGGLDELLDKVMYYLSHERERQEIAYSGFQKVHKSFSYETQVRKMMEIVMTE